METKLKINLDSFIETSEKVLTLIEGCGKEMAKEDSWNEMGNIVTMQNLIDGISELEELYKEDLQLLYDRAQAIYASALD